MNEGLPDFPDQEGRVPHPLESPLETALKDLYHECRDLHTSNEQHVEPTALTEYCLVVADQVMRVEDDRKAEVEAGNITGNLSPETKKAFDGKGGVSECVVSDKLLERTKGTTSYFDREAGKRKFRTLGPTIYEPGPLTTAAHEACSENLDGGPAEWAEAAAALVENDDSSKLSDLKNRGSTKNAAVGGCEPGTDAGVLAVGGGRNPGQVERGDLKGSSASPTSKPTSSIPYGCDIDADEETASESPNADGMPSSPTERGTEGGRERSLEETAAGEDSGSERSLERYAPDRDRWKTRGTLAQRWYLDERVRHVSERLQFLHLYGWALRPNYSSSNAVDDHMPWVGIEAEFMEQHMGAPYHSTEKTWRGSELIEPYRDGFYIAEMETRMYRIYKDVLHEFMELGNDSRRYWLHTEEVVRTSPPSPMSSDLSDENNNSHPHLIQQGMEALSDVRQPIKLQPIRDAIEAKSEEHTQKAKAQKLNLQMALETIEQQVIDQDGEVSYLKNAYTPDDSGGRISFKKGGPQGMMGEVKQRAFDIDGLRNFDISSCHTSALKQWADELEELGVEIDTSPLDDYPGKYEAADKHDLPVGLVKVTEHGVKNSGYLPATLAQGEVIEEKIAEELDDDDNQDEKFTLDILDEAREADVDTERAVETLYEIFADYRRVAVEIAEALLTTYWDEHKHPGGPRGWCMENHAGKSFYRCEVIEDDEEDSWCHDARTAVMAWALRGLESAFCHAFAHFTTHIETITTAANEHDGLMLLDEAESEEVFQNDLQHAIDYARERSGFTRATFVEKDFADEEDVEALYGEEDVEEVYGEHENTDEDEPEDTGGQNEREQDVHPAMRGVPESTRKAIERYEKSRARWRQENPDPNLSEKEMAEMRGPGHPAYHKHVSPEPAGERDQDEWWDEDDNGIYADDVEVDGNPYEPPGL